MATAEELLAAETGANKVLTIDGDLRTISIPVGFGVFGVESDDDVLRVHFRGPRYYHDVDLSKFKLRVNITNAQGGEDSYPVTDMAVEDDAITFSWLIGRFAAQYHGQITFSLCFREMDSEGTVTREFNTTTANGTILKGLETSEHIVQKNPDVLENIILRLESLEEHGIPASSLDTTLSISGKAADAKAVGDALSNAANLVRIVVTIDPITSTASHSSADIIDFVNGGGDVVLKSMSGGYVELSGIVSDMVLFKGIEVYEDRSVQYLYTVKNDKTYTMLETVMEKGISDEQASQIQSNTDAIADIQDSVVSGNLTVENKTYTLTMTLESGGIDTVVLETDENNYPTKVVYNGKEIRWTVTGV